jgi:hypothetical protein
VACGKEISEKEGPHLEYEPIFALNVGFSIFFLSKEPSDIVNSYRVTLLTSNLLPSQLGNQE